MLCKTCKQEIPDSSAFCPWCGKKQTAAPRKALKRPNGAGSVYKLSGRRKSRGQPPRTVLSLATMKRKPTRWPHWKSSPAKALPNDII